MAQFYRPEVFQGNLKMNNYFEGWYFKNVSGDLNSVYSFIPGVSLTKTDPHAFIQVIEGITGKTEYLTYPLSKFKWNRKSLYLKVGDSVFTDKYIDLNIANDTLKISGRLDFSNNILYPKRLFSPGIMGWYSFIPFMECKHGIVSLNHDLNGSISVNDRLINFDRGKGYIEKDWGTSFPEAWIWIQSNNFTDRNSSFTFSVAKIPWMGKFFIGFIAFLYFDKNFYLFSTYNGSKITEIKYNPESLDIEMRNHNCVLRVRAVKSTFGVLMAPVSGIMSRRIKESVDSEVTVDLYDNDRKLLYNDTSKRAGLEIIEKIFEYLEV